MLKVSMTQNDRVTPVTVWWHWSIFCSRVCRAMVWRTGKVDV